MSANNANMSAVPVSGAPAASVAAPKNASRTRKVQKTILHKRLDKLVQLRDKYYGLIQEYKGKYTKVNNRIKLMVLETQAEEQVAEDAERKIAERKTFHKLGELFGMGLKF